MTGMVQFKGLERDLRKQDIYRREPTDVRNTECKIQRKNNANVRKICHKLWSKPSIYYGYAFYGGKLFMSKHICMLCIGVMLIILMLLAGSAVLA